MIPPWALVTILVGLVAAMIAVALIDATSQAFSDGPTLITTLGGVFACTVALAKGGSNGKA